MKNSETTMNDKMTVITNKTPKERIADLNHDNSHLYFLLGALTDAYSDLNEIAKHEFMKSLEKKLEAADPDCADTLSTLMEAMDRE